MTEVKLPGLKQNFGRRGFMKGMAAGLGLAALSATGCSPQALEETTEEEKPLGENPDQIFQGVCHGVCGGSAALNIHVRDGKIVKTSVRHNENDSELDHICPRGLTHAQQTYLPERLQYPMRRVEGSERGAGEWERITWDEAIDEVVTKWKGYIEEFGPESIGFMYGSGSNLSTQYSWMRLLNAFGGTQWAEFDCMASLNVGKDVFGRSMFLVGNDQYDMLNSKYIFVWANNMTESRFEEIPLFWKAREAGAQIIVIDPNYTDAAAQADRWIPIRPTTDGALAMAMTKIIIDEGKADEEYLRKNTVAPFLVAENGFQHLHAADVGIELEVPAAAEDSGGMTMENANDAAEQMESPKDEFGRPIDYIVFDADGNFNTIDKIENPVLTGSIEINGVTYKTAYQHLIERVEEWSAERASEVCDIPVETIHELADMYAEGPTRLNLGFGIDRYCNGGVATLCLYAMAIVAGQIGRPGGGIGGHNASGGAFRMDAIHTDFLATWYPPNAVYTSIMAATTYLPEVIETGMYNGSPLPVKSIISYCNNHLATSPDRNAQLLVEENVEFLICVDTFMTESAAHSDLILPNPYWFEYETMASRNRFNDKAIEPLFETKSDVEIVALIGQAMGFEGFDIDNEAFSQMYFENDDCREKGFNWDYFKENKVYVNPNERMPFIYGNVDYQNVFTNTPGRAAFFLENPINYFDTTKPLDKKLAALPHFKLPNEAWAETVDTFEMNPLAEKYPMRLFSTHDILKAHTLWSKVPQLLEINPEPTVSISPEDAKARDISENDYARMFNDRGSMVARVHIDAGCRPGVLRTEHGWWTDQHVEGDKVNALNSVAMDHQWPTLEHTDLLCQIEKHNIN